MSSYLWFVGLDSTVEEQVDAAGGIDATEVDKHVVQTWGRQEATLHLVLV